MNGKFMTKTALLGLAALFSSSSFADQNWCEPWIMPSSQQVEMFNLINETRRKGHQCGNKYMKPVHQLYWDCRLGEAAKKHVKDQAKNNFTGSIGSDGLREHDRLIAVGYNVEKGKGHYSIGVFGAKSSRETLDHALAVPYSCEGVMGSNVYEFGSYMEWRDGRPLDFETYGSLVFAKIKPVHKRPVSLWW